VLRKCKQVNNWGKWGKDDQLGVLNYITPEDIIEASKLIQKGKVFRLGLNLDENGPQNGLFGGRWNPMHQMLATGTDAVQGIQEPLVGMRYADDAINLPTQCATQWDALAHVFEGEKMWNGYDATLVDVRGAHKNGIEHFADKMVGRGVLLDVARYKRKKRLADGEEITIEDLENTAKKQGVEVRRGDFVLVNTWGIEVRPNRSVPGVNQPWHWVTIPHIGIVHGEIWYLRELVEDCKEDGRYEFFLSAPPLVITRGTGSPINPQAIK